MGAPVVAAKALGSAAWKRLASMGGGILIPGLGWISAALFAYSTIRDISNAVGFTEDNLERATREAIQRQDREKAQVMGDYATAQAGSQLTNRMGANANRILEFSDLLRSGTFENDPGLPGTGGADDLVTHVSKRLGMTPTELAARTRPNTPISKLGLDLGVY